MKQMKFHTLLILCMFTLTIGVWGKVGFAENINPRNDGSQYAYRENIGWLNFEPVFGDGVTVDDIALASYAWGENIGWIHFQSATTVSYKVQTHWPWDSDLDRMLDSIKGTDDTDGEGIFNYLDTDSDNKGIPDDWADANGLNPIGNDADEDPDYGDFTNLKEYEGGSDPLDFRSSPGGGMIEIQMDFPVGWSLMSMPVKPDSLFASDVFPNAKVIYGFEKSIGYIRIRGNEELEIGKGYWILFYEEQFFTLIGQPIYEYTFMVDRNGWDMIGGCSYPAHFTIDSGNIVVIYHYKIGIGYERVPDSENLKPGKGYWFLFNNITGQVQCHVESVNAIELKMLGDYVNGKYHFCTDEKPCSSSPALARLCPENDQNCDPTGVSNISWTVKDVKTGVERAFSHIVLIRRTCPVGYKLYLSGGPGYVNSGMFLYAYNTSNAQIKTDVEGFSVTYYNNPIVPGVDNEIRFEGSGQKSNLGESYLFWHESYDVGIVHPELHAKIDLRVQHLLNVTGAPHVYYHAFFAPAEISGAHGGDGNFSFGNGNISVNYGNPPWLAAKGINAEFVMLYEMVHEYTHELYNVSISPQLTGNTSCLNEGLADGLGNFLGYIENKNFAYENKAGETLFANGCLDSGIPDRSHEKGNCVLWHMKEEGYLSDNFFNSLFTMNIKDVFNTNGNRLLFNSCSLSYENTGNIYVVLFSEAAGKDVSSAFTRAGIPHAGSYNAAKIALGLI